jgi:replication-associated recombination protein RarA
MTQIIGQDRLLNIINNYTFQTLPKALLLVGPKGCGKHTLVNYIKEKFELDLEELEDKVNSEELLDYFYSTLNTLYLIDLDKFTDKQQNQFLKFIEEPSKSSYIVLIAESESNILPTILNRCIRYHLDAYTPEQLKQIIQTDLDPRAFEIYKTPGKLTNLSNKDFLNTFGFAEKLVLKVSQATYANTMSITNRINYKDFYNKIDFDLFLDTVEYLAFEDFKLNNSKLSLDIFKLTVRYKQLATKKTLIREALMLNYLTALWEVAR